MRMDAIFARWESLDVKSGFGTLGYGFGETILTRKDDINIKLDKERYGGTCRPRLKKGIMILVSGLRAGWMSFAACGPLVAFFFPSARSMPTAWHGSVEVCILHTFFGGDVRIGGPKLLC